jgi:hypothetical protein
MTVHVYVTTNNNVSFLAMQYIKDGLYLKIQKSSQMGLYARPDYKYLKMWILIAEHRLLYPYLCSTH